MVVFGVDKRFRRGEPLGEESDRGDAHGFRYKTPAKTANDSANSANWHFIGPALLTLVIVLAEIESQNLEEIEVQAAASPSVGDVWIVNANEVMPDLAVPYPYGPAIVKSIDADSIELEFSDWYYRTPSSARQAAKEALAKDQDYFAYSYWIRQSEFVTLQQAEHIQLVDTWNEELCICKHAGASEGRRLTY